MSRRAYAFSLTALASLFLGAGVRPPGLGDISALKIERQPDRIRVVIETSQRAAFEVHALANPARYYVDLDEVWIEAAIAAPQTVEGPSPLRAVRGGQNTLRRARIVLELEPGTPAPSVVVKSDPPGLVIEVPLSRRVPAVASAPPSKTAPSAAPREPRVIQDWDTRRVRRIVLDAGHGGKDPGALGPGRVREAAIVLAIANELRNKLSAQGFEVVMTRKGDRFLDLSQRSDLANARDADLFISLHANATRSGRTSGVETYLLDTRFDRQTARVAARENGTTVAQLSELQVILASLRLGNNERYAAKLADVVHGSLVKRLRRSWPETPDLGVKRGPFLVLFQADMPAILVEVGFVTHPKEVRRMKTPAFARAAAEGIAAGVVAYRDEHARRVVARR